MSASGASLDELVLHNTRLTRRNRRALELVAQSGRTLQDMTNEAVTAWLQAHYPDALAAIGDQEREHVEAVKLLAERSRSGS